MGRPNTGITFNPTKSRYSKGRHLNHANLQKILDGIKVGLHPEVAAARAGWLPQEFDELLGRNEKFQRLMLKRYADYEYERAEQVNSDKGPRMAMEYLQTCRKRWRKKVDVSLAPLAKKALDKLAKTLGERSMISGQEAYEIVVLAFAEEGAESVFE